MIKENSNVAEISRETLKEVAKLVWNNEPIEKSNDLPNLLIPGPNAIHRASLNQEHEIIKQKINLAYGRNPLSGTPTDKIVHVVEAACEKCPTTRYVVTNNCQKCINRPCLSSCRFDAIHMDLHKSKIDPDKCKKCGMCEKACPYGAIVYLDRPCKKHCPVGAITMDEFGVVKIDDKKCIQCGICVNSCPFGAVSDKSFLVDVIDKIKANKRVVGMIAPALEGQFGPGISMGSLKDAFKKVGFDDVVEVALGADMTAYYEAQEWVEAYNEGKKMTTSCCPAFVNMLNIHYPTLLDNMSSTVSPMCALSRYLKSQDPNVITVFIGPCIAKKSESLDPSLDGNADYVLTINEALALLESKDVTFEVDKENLYQEGSVYAKRFCNSGGVTKAVVQAFTELNENITPQVSICNGAAECKKALALLKSKRLPEDFIEGMVCIGGCVSGPVSYVPEMAAKKDKNDLINKADKRNIKENLDKYDMTKFSMHRSEV